MKHYMETKIGKAIAKGFDSRLELAVITYLMQRGTDRLKDVTEDDILKVEGNAMMTQEFCQALVKTAVQIAKKCTEIEICEYIRKYICMTPQMEKVTFYRNDYNEEGWEILCYTYGVDTNKESFVVIGFVDEEDE